MSCPIVSIEGGDKCWERDSNQTMDDLIKEYQSGISMPLFKGVPAQS